jgi:hypothetical protein
MMAEEEDMMMMMLLDMAQETLNNDKIYGRIIRKTIFTKKQQKEESKHMISLQQRKYFQ